MEDLTKKQQELLDTLDQEPSGKLTNAMVCFLIQTTPQAYGKLVKALVAKDKVYHCDDAIWSCIFEK